MKLQNLLLLITLYSNLNINKCYGDYNNMNGDIYDISNRNSSSDKQFSTIFNEIIPNVEYFDVYSPPITSRYADVYWTMMDPVRLPQNIIDRFDNKVLPIVGYEQDQVFENGDSVPITWAYNHHYGAYIQGKNTELVRVNKTEKDDYGQYNHGAHQQWKIIPNVNEKGQYKNIPTNTLFSEGNGGESRNSFHGYPRNMAQLVLSPVNFLIQPMQIDTRNRDPKYINNSVYHEGILPKTVVSPHNASYSGLLECPCTDRINKTVYHNYSSIIYGECSNFVLNTSECFKQVKLRNNKILNNVSSVLEVNSNMYPQGCSYYVNSLGYVNNIFLNNYDLGEVKSNCGDGTHLYNGLVYHSFDSDNLINLNVSLDTHKDLVNITITGPVGRWFGVGFGSYTMGNNPYAIIFSDEIFELNLGDHSPGTNLTKSFTLLEDSNDRNLRTVIISRRLQGLNSNYYTFSRSEGSIPLIMAIGNGEVFSYHKYRTGTSLSLNSINSYTCLCDSGTSGTINSIPFQKNCLPEPYGDLIRQKNPSCFIDKYQGGLACCHHKNVLLDKNQIQPEHEMTYRIKFRFYFQNYTNQHSLLRLYLQTEQHSGEYDIPKCEEGTPKDQCIHSITARFKGIDMIDRNLVGNSTGAKLIYVAPHCHAATCIDMELYNQDTGDLICKVEGILGKGNRSVKYDEKGYIKLNPCVFGYDEGLLEPPTINWDTNLFSIKRNNNTWGHYGEMASWQMRGYLV